MNFQFHFNRFAKRNGASELKKTKKAQKFLSLSLSLSLCLSLSRHSLKPEWIATTPPVMFSCDTDLNPASRIISSNSSCLGNFRMDSTKY